VTPGRHSEFPTRGLPHALVAAGIVEIPATAITREQEIARHAAGFPAYPLRGLRRRRGSERLAALGAAAADGHPHNVAGSRLTVAFSATGVDHDLAAPTSRPRGQVDHDLAAGWISRR